MSTENVNDVVDDVVESVSDETEAEVKERAESQFVELPILANVYKDLRKSVGGPPTRPAFHQALIDGGHIRPDTPNSNSRITNFQKKMKDLGLEPPEFQDMPRGRAGKNYALDAAAMALFASLND